MKDNVIKAVFDFTHRINDNGTYKVSFEWKAESNDISISIATKQYRSVIDILIENYKVSAYMHGQGVVNGQQIADLQNSLSNWHKVDATLIINGDIRQDED